MSWYLNRPWPELGFRVLRERATPENAWPRLTSFDIWGTNHRAGDRVMANVSLDRPAGAAGALVTLETGEGSGRVTLASITVPPGRMTYPFGVQSIPSMVGRNITVTARLGESSRTDTSDYEARPQAGTTAIGPLGLQFIQVPAGQFRMGCGLGDFVCEETRGQGPTAEGPGHNAILTKAFEIGRYEVTQAQWQALMGDNPSAARGPDLPVEQVTWNEVQEFISRLNARNDGYLYRLPTEAEWEYAARAGSLDPFAGGVLHESAWYGGNNPSGRTAPVGMKKANHWNLHDVLGNVAEWVQDRPRAFTAQTVTNPTGPAEGANRVVRGDTSTGGIIAYVQNPWLVATITRRSILAAASRSGNVGFRCVRERKP